ncbi:MAG: hypothetical protein KBT46_09625, partial [Ruminococcus sp.]|nr:hypothetical protein [Candidatus Copronaster equi]
MKLRLKGISVEISFYFVAVITLMIIVFPQSKGLFCFFFCIFHELGHLAAMMIFGKKIYSFYFGYFGIKIVTGGKLLPTGEEII